MQRDQSSRYLTRSPNAGRFRLLSFAARRLLAAAPLVVCALVQAAPVASAATISVTTTEDDLAIDGNCSLREALQAANLDRVVDACRAGSGADTIVLAAGTYPVVTLGPLNDDTGLSGDLDVFSDLTITGAGASTTTLAAVVGDFGGRVLDVASGAHVMISGVTIARGNLLNGGGAGLRNAGTLTLRDSVVAGNSVGGELPSGSVPEGEVGGGGILNLGALTVVNSTISGNTAIFLTDGGGIWNRGVLTLTNSTVSGNEALQFGGGIANEGTATLVSSTVTNNAADLCCGGVSTSAFGGSLSLGNTIISRNIAGQSSHAGMAPDCFGPITSQGYNLIGDLHGCVLDGDLTGNRLGDDPHLGPLTSNGGATPTHALQPGSAAVDAGSPEVPGSTALACPATDQRGVERPRDGDGDGVARCDIGAFELRPVGHGTQPPNAVPPLVLTPP
jgi:CSLREA domain-containing protein